MMKKKLLLPLLLVQVLVLTNCKQAGDKESSAAATETTAQAAQGNLVLIETNLGNIKIQLYDFTPQHKENFLKLAREGFYDGTLFHRVIPGFMIQGGDPDSKTAQPGQQLGMGGPGYNIPAEISARHFRGALAAARMPDQVNPERQSSGSQFYIVHGTPVEAGQLSQLALSLGFQYTQAEIDYYVQYGGAPMLDNQYTVFGQVTEGMEVVDKIANVARDQADRPLEDIGMKVKIL
jgi:peptidyl-prolyl cis-trans isomerase B (cyclophilin B)